MDIEVRELADLGTGARRVSLEWDVSIGEVQPDVHDIVERARREDDVTVQEFSSESDGVQADNIDATDAAEHTYDEIDDNVRKTIEVATANVHEFHEKQVPEDWHEEFGDIGTRGLRRQYRPPDRVGVYAPDGTAACPSSVLMDVIPTKVTGVEHVAAATSPAEPMNPVTLAATHVAGADVVYSVGGAQGIAALAYGTETVKAVQKVAGPGNKWVTTTKAEVRDGVDIDFLTGSPEALVVADETAKARFAAADLTAQAEHDPNASAVAITDNADLAAEIVAKAKRQAGERERAGTIEAALEGDASGIPLARSMSEAVLFAKEYATEHLAAQTGDDKALLDRINSAGSVFLGPYTSVAADDYASGTNHVPPTGGSAKRQGGLSVDHFVRSMTVQRLNHDGLSELSETITTLAEAEGLDTHTQSVRERFEE